MKDSGALDRVCPDPKSQQSMTLPATLSDRHAHRYVTLRFTADAHVADAYVYSKLNDAATLVNLGFRYQVDKNVQVYGTIQNVFNTNYLAQGMTYTTYQGSTVNTSAVPSMGPPRWFTLGVRATF